MRQATTSGVLTTLQHCADLMAQREDGWRRRMERELERRRQLEELVARQQEAAAMAAGTPPPPGSPEAVAAKRHIMFGGPDYQVSQRRGRHPGDRPPWSEGGQAAAARGVEKCPAAVGWRGSPPAGLIPARGEEGIRQPGSGSDSVTLGRSVGMLRPGRWQRPQPFLPIRPVTGLFLH